MTEHEKQWYVIQVMSGQESKVQKNIAERLKYAEQDIVSAIGESTVPTEEVVEMRGGKKYTTERKFFPSYVLVHMVLNDQVWHFINQVPGVLKFVGGKNAKPAPISQKEVNRILQRVESGAQRLTPKVLYEVGEVIRVTDGPFADFDGVVEDLNYEKSRVKISVTIFGRATPVELSFDQVQKVT